MYRNCLAVLSVVALIGLTNAPVRADIRTQEKSAPRYFNPSPNPLQFPTLPKQVRIQGAQPITLQQAQELARRNNWSLQAAQLAGELSLATLRKQKASLYPALRVFGRYDR